MMYELRTYHAMPGRLPDLNKRFAEITLDFFKKHGIDVVGFWTNELGGSSDQLIYMLAYESLADREKKWHAFFTDKERLAKFAETEKNGPLVARLTAQMLFESAAMRDQTAKQFGAVEGLHQTLGCLQEYLEKMEVPDSSRHEKFESSTS